MGVPSPPVRLVWRSGLPHRLGRSDTRAPKYHREARPRESLDGRSYSYSDVRPFAFLLAGDTNDGLRSWRLQTELPTRNSPNRSPRASVASVDDGEDGDEEDELMAASQRLPALTMRSAQRNGGTLTYAEARRQLAAIDPAWERQRLQREEFERLKSRRCGSLCGFIARTSPTMFRNASFVRRSSRMASFCESSFPAIFRRDCSDAVAYWLLRSCVQGSSNGLVE